MASAAHPGEAPSPLLVLETLMAHQRSAALRAAIELDVFRVVGEGPGDVATLARQCSASERGLRILCDYLTIIGLLSKEAGRYRHTPTSAMFLDPRSLPASPQRRGSWAIPPFPSPSSTSRTSFGTDARLSPAKVRSNRRIRCGWSSRTAWRP